MGRFAWVVGVWLAGAALAACSITAADQNAAVCTTLCRCLDNGLPGPAADCTNRCEADLDSNSGQSLQSCYDCVARNSECSVLENQCVPACAGQIVTDPVGDAAQEPGK